MNTLLTWLMNEDMASAILGDLAEQRHRRAQRSRLGAASWYVLALAGIALFIGLRRGLESLRRWVKSGLGFNGLHQDFKQTGRALRRTPWYSVTGIGVIALGMSLATTAFAVVDGVLFKPLPYRAPDELYSIAGASSKLPPAPGAVSRVPTTASIADLEAWSVVTAPASLTGYDVTGPTLPLEGGVRPRVAQVEAHFLDVLGVTPLIGGFREEHFRAPAAIRPALISYGLWQTCFGGAANIVGQTAGQGNNRIQIVGVMPRSFAFPVSSRRLIPDVMTPIATGSIAAGDVTRRWLTVIGRIPAGTLPSDIEARVAGPLGHASVRPLRDVLTAGNAQVSKVVFAAAGFLVLLSALTVAGLTASRLEDRRGELSMRRALGGSSQRIIRLLAAESILIVATGAALGWLAASPLLGITMALMPPGLMFLKPPVLDVRVFVFGVIATAVTVAFVTLWATRSTLGRSLGATNTGRSTPSRAAARGRSVLIAAQVAASLVMVLAGSLLGASLIRVWQEDPGFNPHQAATVRIDERDDATPGTMVELLQTLRALPGVTAAAGLGEPFLDNLANGNGFESPLPETSQSPVEGISVTGGFFAAAGIRTVHGRLPTDDELDRGDPVIVVSEHVARTYWPGASVLGQTLKKEDGGRDFEVIGIVPDARYRSLDRDPDGAIYSPLAADRRWALMNVIVRFNDDASSRLPGVANVIASRFPMYSVRSARTITTSLGESIRIRRFQTWMFASFGLSAVVLTGAGILGMMAMTTARRTREVGIRMAVGATRANVIAHLLREQMLPVAIGLAAGAGVAVWAAQFVRAFVYKLSVYDPLVWAAAVFTIVGTAVVGTLVPARRASKIDPVNALRLT